MAIFRITLILCLFLLLGACEEDQETLLQEITATFTGDFSQPGSSPGLLFYSDLDGTSLWSGSWEGNDTLHAVLSSGFPNRISFTTVTDYNDGSRVSIVTNMNVKPDSYIWQGGGADYRWAEYQGNAYIQLRNAPDHTGYILSSNGSSRTGTGMLSDNSSVRLFASVSDVFLRIDPNDFSPKYIFIEDVHPGDTISIDFDQMSDMVALDVSVFETDYDRTLYVYGFNDSYYKGRFLVHRVVPWQDSNNFDTIYYPQDFFDGYVTRLFIDEESYPTNNGWYSTWNSENIPTNLTPTSIGFEFEAGDNSDVRTVTDDNCSQFTYLWSWLSDEGTQYSWQVYTDLKSIHRPQLPSEFFDRFPDFILDSLGLARVAMMNADNLSFDNYIESFFKSGLGFYDLFSTVKERYRDPAGLRDGGYVMVREGAVELEILNDRPTF